MARKTLGPLEVEVLGCIAENPDNAYGVAIVGKMAESAGRKPPVSNIYLVLDRLANKKLLSAVWGEPQGFRGGRRRKYYAIEPAGREALAHSLPRYQRMVG